MIIHVKKNILFALSLFCQISAPFCTSFCDKLPDNFRSKILKVTQHCITHIRACWWPLYRSWGHFDQYIEKGTNPSRHGVRWFLFNMEDGKTYQTVTIWNVTIWKHFIRWLISGMKIFQNLFGMKYIQMVTGKWYENYSDRTQIDLVWTSFIRWLVIGMKISYCHQMNCHHLKYPLNLTL